jgi:DNA-binding NarL/FixJ family response regulator
MLRILCAKACFGLGCIEKARNYLSDAVSAAMPHGFITPFTESMAVLGGLLEECIERSFPECYDAVMRQWERIVPNWIMFHNHFTKKHLEHMLNPREYEKAQLVARGVSNKKIAEQFRMSVRTLENQLQIIYDELLIEKGANATRRKELVNNIL